MIDPEADPAYDWPGYWAAAKAEARVNEIKTHIRHVMDLRRGTATRSAEHRRLGEIYEGLQVDLGKAVKEHSRLAKAHQKNKEKYR